MALMQETPLTLTGGCFCSAIRYTISIPAMDSRPLVPGALPTPVDASGTTIPTRLPLTDIDHCQSCRRACGGLVQAWLIVPHAWVTFALQRREEGRTGSYSEPFIGSEGVVYRCGDVVVPSEDVLRETYVERYESSPDIHRTFCTRCGTGLTYCYAGDRPKEWTLGPIVDVAIGSLDQESIERVRAERHGWWDDGVGWIKELMTKGDGGFLIRHPTGRVNSKVEGDNE